MNLLCDILICVGVFLFWLFMVAPDDMFKLFINICTVVKLEVNKFQAIRTIKKYFPRRYNYPFSITGCSDDQYTIRILVFNVDDEVDEEAIHHFVYTTLQSMVNEDICLMCSSKTTDITKEHYQQELEECRRHE